MVGGGAVVADERPDVGSNRAAAASTGDSVLVLWVLTGGEGRWRHACNRVGDVAVVKATPLVGGNSGSATSPKQDRPEAWCQAGTGGDSCSRRERFGCLLVPQARHGLGQCHGGGCCGRDTPVHRVCLWVLVPHAGVWQARGVSD